MFSGESYERAERRIRNVVGDDFWLARCRKPDWAEHALEGEVPFCIKPGTVREYYKVGRRGIDWSGPHLNHQEWPAQLHRFFWLPALSGCYADSGDTVYAMAAREYIEDFIAAHPLRRDAGWEPGARDSTLDISIRSVIWGGVLFELLASAPFDDDFVERIVASLAAQLDYLALRHSRRAGNWRIAHADALVLSALRFAGLPQSPRWLKIGCDILNEAFHRQLLPDGVHCERNPGYHNWMAKIFSRYWRLAREFDELDLAIQADKLDAMFDYSLAMTKPNGHLNAMHDSQSGSGAGRTHVSGPFHQRAVFRRAAGLDANEMPPVTQDFAVAGQACWRSGWDESAVYAAFDASTWGGGHCHLSRNAVQLHALGRSLIVDPGTLTYEASDPMMAAGKGTRAHSTINLNGWNQSTADPSSTFASAPGYDLATGFYQGGYWPGAYTWTFKDGMGCGIWASHHRTFLWVRDRFFLVLDHVTQSPQNLDTRPVVESNWQLSAGPVILDPRAPAAWTGHDDVNVMMLFPLCTVPGAALSVHEGESDPPRGWLLDVNSAYVKAPQLSLSGPMEGPQADFAAVLIPYAGAARPDVTASAERNGCGRLSLEWASGAEDRFYWSYKLAFGLCDFVEGVETDASLLHLRFGENGDRIGGMAHDATYVRPYSPRRRDEPGMFVF